MLLAKIRYCECALGKQRLGSKMAHDCFASGIIHRGKQKSNGGPFDSAHL